MQRRIFSQFINFIHNIFINNYRFIKVFTTSNYTMSNPCNFIKIIN